MSLDTYIVTWHFEGDSARANIVQAPNENAAMLSLEQHLKADYGEDEIEEIHVDNVITLAAAVADAGLVVSVTTKAT